MNVLITAASRRVSLIKLFSQAVQPYGGKVIAVDYEPYSPALFFADKHFKVPLVKDPTYLPTIQALCIKEKIELIIPTIDPELLLWANAREQFDRNNITISISPPETIHTFTDKWNTYHAFFKENIPFPYTFLPTNTSLPRTYPLFIKPRNGRGSVGAFTIRNETEYLFFTQYVKDPLVQNFLEGKEFTVDAFFDRNGTLISCIPRYRLVIRSGVSDRGITFLNENLTSLIEKIARLYHFQGAINFQGKILNDKITFFEINPRFSGGIQLSAAAGPNFAQLLVKEVKGEPLTQQLYNYQPNILMTSYEDSLFINQENVLMNPK